MIKNSSQNRYGNSFPVGMISECFSDGVRADFSGYPRFLCSLIDDPVCLLAADWTVIFLRFE